VPSLLTDAAGLDDQAAAATGGLRRMIAGVSPDAGPALDT